MNDLYDIKRFEGVKDLETHGQEMAQSDDCFIAMCGRMLLGVMPSIYTCYENEVRRAKDSNLPIDEFGPAMQNALANLYINAFIVCFSFCLNPNTQFQAFGQIVAHTSYAVAKNITEQIRAEETVDAEDAARAATEQDADFPNVMHRAPRTAQ